MDKDFNIEQRRQLLLKNPDPDDQFSENKSQQKNSNQSKNSLRSTVQAYGINDSCIESDLAVDVGLSNRYQVMPQAVIGEESEGLQSSAKTPQKEPSDA